MLLAIHCSSRGNNLHKVAREVSLNKIADVAIHTCSKRIAKACACSNTRATRGAD